MTDIDSLLAKARSKAEGKTWTDRADDAANFLTATDTELAIRHHNYEKVKKKAKRVWSAIFKRVQGNIEERKAQAEDSEEYQAVVAEEFEALLDYEKLRNQRDTEKTVIDFWRSWNKAKTDGVI